MWVTTIFQSKQNEMMLQILKGDPSSIKHLAKTKYYRALQENILTKVDAKVQLDEGHMEFLELSLSIKTEVD